LTFTDEAVISPPKSATEATEDAATDSEVDDEMVERAPVESSPVVTTPFPQEYEGSEAAPCGGADTNADVVPLPLGTTTRTA
jgi:hypothetical protein